MSSVLKYSEGSFFSSLEASLSILFVEDILYCLLLLHCNCNAYRCVQECIYSSNDIVKNKFLCNCIEAADVDKNTVDCGKIESVPCSMLIEQRRS